MFRCRTFRIGVGPDFVVQEREVCVVVACEKKENCGCVVVSLRVCEHI